MTSEIRSFTSRSAVAAKEIKDLIQDSVKKVEDGSVRVAQSERTFEQIVSSVNKASDITAWIAPPCPGLGVDQANRAVMPTDEMLCRYQADTRVAPGAVRPTLTSRN
jgi:methyl-accepting chemotaxis protein